jgi:hypothetical protein
MERGGSKLATPAPVGDAALPPRTVRLDADPAKEVSPLQATAVAMMKGRQRLKLNRMKKLLKSVIRREPGKSSQENLRFAKPPYDECAFSGAQQVSV